MLQVLLHSGGAGGREPQSAQSVPRAQFVNSAPGPPSSQLPSDAELQVLTQRGGGGGSIPERGPQSVQSVPRAQLVNSAPGPPSSQLPSDAELQVLPQGAVGDKIAQTLSPQIPLLVS